MPPAAPGPPVEAPSERLRDRFDRWADRMASAPSFYDWIVAALRHDSIPPAARIIDVGCGSGELLHALAQAGYTNLAGADFAPRCLELAARRAPGARLQAHDFTQTPLAETYEVALMTTVVDFVEQPEQALTNVRASLAPGGALYVTIRNPWAYLPFAWLRPALPALRRWPRVYHWAAWLALPLAARRDWPAERMFTPPAMRRLLAAAGFHVRAERAAEFLPMLRVPEWPALSKAWDRLDRLPRALGSARVRLGGFRYLFVCQAGPSQ